MDSDGASSAVPPPLHVIVDHVGAPSPAAATLQGHGQATAASSASRALQVGTGTPPARPRGSEDEVETLLFIHGWCVVVLTCTTACSASSAQSSPCYHSAPWPMASNPGGPRRAHVDVSASARG